MCDLLQDSLIGLQAAKGAGMRCIITYTSSTKSQVARLVEAVFVEADAGVFSLCLRQPQVSAQTLNVLRVQCTSNPADA